ncbi:MAG TPA: zf-HC2 domain-containing protein [Thermoanaerobaculia bacterium]|nr:zf-HC2 domain-containing protein [Thermoanaerobaculia bacterium]
MDHAEATTTHATDRYLLGELTAAEADAFEEHYFDCLECAEELRIGVQFMNGGRGIAREAAAPEMAPVARFEPRPRRTAWLPAAVAAALVLAVGAPILMMQQRPAVQGPSFEVVKPHSFLLAGSRAAADVPTLKASETSGLYVDVPSEPAYPAYEARLRLPDGTTLARPFTPDPNGEPTELAVSDLSAGLHELVIVGMDPAGRPAVIIRRPFNVR